MTYETWSPLFLGMVLAMLLTNSVQWFMYRERIYGLYSLYTLTWAVYFLINYLDLPRNLSNFHKMWLSYTGYILYLELAKLFLTLRERPRFLRWVSIVQWLLLGYIVVKTYVYLFSDFWRSPWHEWVLQPMRFSLLAVGFYIVYSFVRSSDAVARFFVAGTAALLLNHAWALVLLIRSPVLDQDLPFWQHPDLFIQTGVVLDLIFFSLGISYRHRREAVRKAVVEGELAREREQHRLQQLEGELAVQQLRQEKTEAQMRALQSQISPHFLFNSLNSLSSLIGDDPGKAEQFVDELSTVYRYLLQASERELTTLDRELAFIHSYFHLLKTRFGSAIQLDLRVDPRYNAYQICPLTLQLLVENAVKHNVVLTEQPLRIEIATTPNGELTVGNNLQRKPNGRVISTGKGLLNITEKYKLLQCPGFRIQETDADFRVIVPLIKPVAIVVGA